MRSIIRRAAAVAGTLALAGGGTVLSALPASAATVHNTAYGVSASGLVYVSPVAEAVSDSFPLLTHQSAASFNINQLVTGGSIADVATQNGASSSIGRVDVHSAALFVPGLQVGLVHSQCTTNGTTATGSTTLLAGNTLFGALPALPTHPAPNTNFNLPGVHIVLNQQTTTGGQFTVTAMAITLLGGAETVDLGVSSCQATPPPPPVIG